MALKVLKAHVAYSDKGRPLQTELGQVFEESPWDLSTTKIFLARGYIEEVLLEAAAPKVELVEEAVEEEEAEDLSSLSKTKLIELAEERGLDSTGTKKKLLARLQGE